MKAPPGERRFTVPCDLGDELTAGFAGQYIGFKARQLVGRYGYGRSDRLDLEQELKLRLFVRVRKFDARRGPWNSFVVAVVDRQVATLALVHEARLRWEAEQRRLAQSADGPPASTNQSLRSGRRDLDLVDLRLDLEVIVPRLPDELRIIWERLQWDDIRHTARALRVSHMTIYKRLKKLRRAFQSAEAKIFFQKHETDGSRSW
jgi:hypothetical protein